MAHVLLYCTEMFIGSFFSLHLQMLTDLNRVDFGSVQDQAGWVCPNCKPERVQELEKGFKDMLAQNANLGLHTSLFIIIIFF